MSRIRSRGNKDTEIALARLLRAHGICGWRRHLLIRATVDSSKWMVDRPKPSGKDHPLSTQILHPLTVRPDFVFLKSRTAIFVDGCFWHGCPRHETKPKNNRAFWRRKFSANKKRDRLVNRALRRANWRVLRIWECELAKIKMTSTPHPGPLPVRGGEGAETRLVRQIQKALTSP